MSDLFVKSSQFHVVLLSHPEGQGCSVYQNTGGPEGLIGAGEGPG